MMDWPNFHRIVAERGWDFKQAAAHFAPGLISGTIISVAGYGEVNDQPSVEEIVCVEDVRDDSRDAILEAAVRLCRQIDPEFG